MVKFTICEPSLEMHSIPAWHSKTNIPYPFSVTIGFSIITFVVHVTEGVPLGYRPIAGQAYIALSSAMACRVYRAIFLGFIKEHSFLNTSMLNETTDTELLNLEKKRINSAGPENV